MNSDTKSIAFLEKVKSTIQKYKMIQKGDTVVLGLSGGADSVCLFMCLLNFCKELEASVVATHINHGLRGKEADDDEAFVKKLCEKHNIPLFIKRVDLKNAETPQGTEAAGRQVRYAFFNEIAKKYPSSKIATAHNKNDQAETVIMRMIEGTSLSGLCGIKRCAGNIIRPLLDVTRAEIEEFLEINNISFVTDKSNFEIVYKRNCVRHEILPVMQKLNPKVTDAIMRLTDDLCEDEAFINDTVEDTDSIQKLLSMQQSQKRRAVARLLYGAKISDIIDKHIKSVMFLINNQSGKSVDLPGGYVCKKSFDKLIIEKKKYVQKIEKTQLCIGTNKVAGYDITISYGGDIDLDKITMPLYVRRKQSGDYIYKKGMDGKKLLKKLFIEKKIPADERDGVPVIVSGEDVIYTLGTVDKRVLSDTNSENTISITIHKEAE